MDSIEGAKAPVESDVESFFKMAPPLKDRDQIFEKLKGFIERVVRSSGAAVNHTADIFHRIHFLIVLKLQKIQPLKAGGMLLKLPFTTIFEYLQILRMVALSMDCLKSLGMFYLAAAVSDFYVPWENMAKHKIQSAEGPLDMRLTQVPKMLSVIRKDWAPAAFCISFKLETDPDILLQKADTAMRKYGMHVVVANELATYKSEVTVVTRCGKTKVCSQAKDHDLEMELVDILVERHSDHIKKF